MFDVNNMVLRPSKSQVLDERFLHALSALCARTHVIELKDSLDHGDFVSGRLEAAKRDPIVHDHSGA